MQVRITKGQIAVGQEIPWDIINSAGRRLFREGFIFRTEASLNRIWDIELYYESNAEQAPLTSSVHVQSKRSEVIYESLSSQKEINQRIGSNVFNYIDYCIAESGSISEKISEGDRSQLGNIKALIKNIIEIYELAPDACLGAVHLEYEHPLSSLQPVYTAFACLTMINSLNISKRNQDSLVGAALTANLGMFEYFDRLVNQQGALDASCKSILRQHPRQSYKLLVDNGVKDEVWLNTVIQHHERSDGNGYPSGLTPESIALEATVLAAADTYVAMITPRVYRKPLSPKMAMQTIYKAAVANDDLVSIGLIKQLGVYPPGSLVTLANHEFGVVLKRNKLKPLAPLVSVIGSTSGSIYKKPVVRETDNYIYKIIDVYKPEKHLEIDPNLLWEAETPLTFNAAS